MGLGCTWHMMLFFFFTCLKPCCRLFASPHAACSASFLADPAAKNVTLELICQPAPEGQAPTPLAQQLKGLFAGLTPDA